jgi:histidinol-phosphate aminotransferase
MTALRLHLNENLAGCSPAVLDAVRSCEGRDIAEYPDPAGATARAAAHFGVDPESLLLTNGLDEGIQIAALAAAAAADAAAGEAIVAEPAFEVYAQCARAARLRVVRAGPRDGLEWPLEEVLRAVTPATRIVYLADPNNPTGLPAPAGAAAALAAAVPGALIFVDEAYAEFSGRTIIGAALASRARIVVGRTFAKAYGLAGLRIGALVARPDIIASLAPFALAYRTNAVALRALVAALDDPSHARRSVLEAAESRDVIYEWARRAGIPFWASDANFVLLRVGCGAAAIAGDLAREGILIRDKSAVPGCAGCLRITAARPDDTRAALAALEARLAAGAR